MTLSGSNRFQPREIISLEQAIDMLRQQYHRTRVTDGIYVSPLALGTVLDYLRESPKVQVDIEKEKENGT